MFIFLAFFAFVASATAVPVGKRVARSPLELVFARGTSEVGLGIVSSPHWSLAAEYVVTVAQGAQDVASHITAQASACPDQKFALAGYSKGGMVAHEAELPAAVQSKVVAVAVFGDPFRLTQDAFPIDHAVDTVAFCNAGDPVCQNGANVLAHLRYATDGSVGKAATFIAGKFNA